MRPACTEKVDLPVKITLVRPNIGRLEHSLFVDEARMEPLQLGVLAALTPPDVDVVLYDDRCEPIPFDEPTDLVAITVETFTARRAYEVAAAYRQRGVPVIMGGVHARLLPDEVAAHCDSLFVGDAETGWAQVVADARVRRLRPRYDAPVGTPQPGGVRPRRTLFAGKGYLPLTLIQFSRGCPYRCEFCAVSSYFNATHTCRPVAEVVAEIEAQGWRDLFFVDDNLLGNHAAAKQLFRALKPLNVRWVSQASIDMVYDRELMDLMVASGCMGNVIGFESIAPQSLRQMRKAANLRVLRAESAAGADADDVYAHYREPLRILRDYGLQTWAAFVLGYDFDTPASIAHTLQFALENKFTFAAFNILMPYPGTPLYDRLAREGRLLFDGRWWLHPHYRFNHAAFVPAAMTPDELTAAGLHCRTVFNSPRSILWRAFDFKTNLRSPERFLIYALYNPLFRRETFKKQGMRLGVTEADTGTEVGDEQPVSAL